MSQKELNPFEAQMASDNYQAVDKVYKQSAIEAFNFTQPFFKDELVLDIGAGTGISAETYLQGGAKDLCLLEPSVAMLDKAKERLGTQVKFMNIAVDDINTEFVDKIKTAYALNSFHLFPNAFKALELISKALMIDGLFIFNLSKPMFVSELDSPEELQVLRANLDFYKNLHQATGYCNKVIQATIDMMSQLMYSNTQIYSREMIAEITSPFDLILIDYKEVVLNLTELDQRNIWKIVASSYVEDGAVIEELINSVKLPKIVPMRQALFKLMKIASFQ